MSEASHTCTYYCQHGEHAYVALSPLEHEASDVLHAARIWVTHLGWPDVVVRVQPAREMESQQVLRSTMMEIETRTATVRDVAGADYDVTRYRPWLVFVRPRHAAAGEGER